jgi:ParB family transcriptional regulator, chromosome partitioning protein
MSRKSERFFGEVETIDISNIKLPSYRFRTVDENDVERMSNSIKLHGLLQPVVVRPKDDCFEIVAGCTRFLACKSLHWRKIPCHVIQLNEVQTFEVALIENMERKSITPLDEAKAFKKYCFDNGWGSVSELSSKIGKSPSYITKRMALLELPSDVQGHIKNSELKPSTAEEISTIKDPEKQSQLADLIVKRHLTTMKARQLVKEDQDPYYCENSEILEVRSELQPFNKAIVALRIAMSKIAAAIEEDEEGDNDGVTSNGDRKDNIFINELLMYHKRLLHDQIDNLMKSKKKYAKNIFRYRMMLK